MYNDVIVLFRDGTKKIFHDVSNYKITKEYNNVLAIEIKADHICIIPLDVIKFVGLQEDFDI